MICDMMKSQEGQGRQVALEWSKVCCLQRGNLKVLCKKVTLEQRLE